ncbi:MAG: ROK family protein [Candidatus Paceibacterota bacterium]
MSYLLFDIGGTNTRVAVTNDLKTFEKPIRFTTPINFKEGIEKIVAAAQELSPGKIRGAAGAVRGMLSEDRSSILHDETLTKWVEEPLVEKLAKELDTKVIIENDAALGGLGEAHFGAGQGAKIMVYHTISTGVGGAKIEDGRIDSYHLGFEPGKQVLDIDRTILGDDILPTLENLVSGAAVEERTGQKPFDIPQEDSVWDQLAFYLAHGLRNTILYWSPDMIVLGGSMMTGNPLIPIEMVRKHTAAILGDDIPLPNIERAKLKDDSGLYGAMVLLGSRD